MLGVPRAAVSDRPPLAAAAAASDACGSSPLLRLGLGLASPAGEATEPHGRLGTAAREAARHADAREVVV
eukprot:scaffold4921_cov61-Phaeocystis_antarctica.AAC.2